MNREQALKRIHDLVFEASKLSTDHQINIAMWCEIGGDPSKPNGGKMISALQVNDAGFIKGVLTDIGNQVGCPVDHVFEKNDPDEFQTKEA